MSPRPSALTTRQLMYMRLVPNGFPSHVIENLPVPIAYTRVTKWLRPKALETGGCSHAGFESFCISMQNSSQDDWFIRVNMHISIVCTENTSGLVWRDAYVDELPHATFWDAISLVSMNISRRLLFHHSYTSRSLILNMMAVSSQTVSSTWHILNSVCASINASRTIAICTRSVKDVFYTYSSTYMYIGI